MEASQFEASFAIYAGLTIFVGICGMIASRYLLKRGVAPQRETSFHSGGSPNASIRKSKLTSVPSKTKNFKRGELLNHLPSRVKQLHEVQQMAELTAKEREAEIRARCDQLAAILEVMRQQPEHFGEVSQADISAQLSDFYSTITAPVASP
ncbi:unnamed protein product [Hydatigera taeniaeformis]|uniref:BHLH domain-containing protein n=1 Tax=Hydatigena taeniaeformis TaxID=6205 RepID=A0A0R3X1R6_HYDTA|nr:unnamed protein product [Hydatigera taeniaeformis]